MAMARITNGMMTDTGIRMKRRGMVQRTGSSNIGIARPRPLSDTQRAYISAAHKPNPRIGIKPIKPRQKFASKKKTI